MLCLDYELWSRVVQRGQSEDEQQQNETVESEVGAFCVAVGRRVEYLVQASAKGTGYQTLLNSGPGPGSHAIKIIVVGRALSKNTHLATAGLPAPKLPSACQKAYFKTSEQVVSLHALPKSDFRRGKAVAFPQHENFRKYAQTTAVCKDVSAVS
ncbi:hypothetical protein GX51_07040 [Blastomyces parvus]|uniref:Uncharacterized protein n=1 Tax=Blastomyces parvus TaxID=2060905 RepID=A0A2B7WN69_9EURO|nr:hypothetical protein GX51_07040 [Blastomyces parvus]